MKDLLPNWMKGLNQEDLEFIKTFIVQSGSLKEMATIYDVSYPTIRMRLDKVIEKIQLSDNKKDDSYIIQVKAMALDNKISIEAARELIENYRLLKED
ncbi:DUF2089 family protein [Treponema rectale]|jgi:hypothetical protein|uniref:DUF2089 family protein n=1 Tax=Treponema rectale TaxID=744512 RepID=A0A7M1XI36_9SPIR|nr:DUF2089 family protein [Treponema rectale]